MGVVTSSTAMFVGVKWISGLKAEDKLRRNSPDLKKPKKTKQNVAIVVRYVQ